MIVKKKGGMTEFIPSPQEKREGLIRDHTLNLLDNLHKRLMCLEQALSQRSDDAEEFTRVLTQMQKDEILNHKLHSVLSENP